MSESREFCPRTARLFLGTLLLALTMLFAARPALAGSGIVGSYHDFDQLGEPGYEGGGACAFCHQAHGKQNYRLGWARSLAEEAAYFDQDLDPNYIPENVPYSTGTLPCYDCHDDNYRISGHFVDNDPPWDQWPGGEFPQNIAFTDTPALDSTRSVTGFYELSAGFVPNQGGTIPTPPSSPPVLDPIGGHYWKGVNETSNVIQAPYNFGDKMACTICHDPHDSTKTGGNEVMLRTDIEVGGTINIGNNLNASSASRNGTGTGREMCAGCHQYSEDSFPKTLYGVDIPIPPAFTSFTAHSSSDTTTECTLCHPHNSPDCGSCHGSPPPEEAFGYGNPKVDEVLGPHPRHANSAAAGGYDFDCTVCHDTFPATHRDGNYKNVGFETTRNPNGNYVTNTLTCQTIYCHSRGTRINDTENNTGATSRLWSDSPDWRTNDLGCEACHGADPPRSPGVGVNNYGAPDYANGTLVDGIAKANSHSSHGNYQCWVCHNNVIQDATESDGWTILDETLHVNNTTVSFTFNVDPGDKALSDPYFDSYTYDPLGGQCFNVDCHGGADPVWGTTLSCEDCHVTPASDDDNWDLNDDVLSQIADSQWTTTGHGRPVASGWFPWPDDYGNINPPEFGCVTTDGTGNSPVAGCHASKVLHGNLQNPFRLATATASPYNFENPLGTIDNDSIDNFCYTCHLPSSNHVEHSQLSTAGDAWTSPLKFKCTDCHDPHGDSPDYMIHSQVFADSSSNYGMPSLANLGIRPLDPASIDFDVTEPIQAQGDYVAATPNSIYKICQVCHIANDYFRRNLRSTHNGTVQCMECHPHNEGFRETCEACHSALSTYPLAPNVMGDGTNPDTDPPFIDGTYGFYINGHGTKMYMGELIKCEACHDVGLPAPPDVLAPTHLDGTLNTYNWFGKGSDTTNINTSHLLDTFIYRGAVDEQYQLTPDSVCYNRTGCHSDGSVPDPDVGHVHEMLDGDGVVRFGDSSTNPNPKGFLPTPWTARDVNDQATGGSEYGICISCHEPHGSDESGRPTCPDFPDGEFHMTKYDFCDPEATCNANCHGP